MVPAALTSGEPDDEYHRSVELAPGSGLVYENPDPASAHTGDPSVVSRIEPNCPYWTVGACEGEGLESALGE